MRGLETRLAKVARRLPKPRGPEDLAHERFLNQLYQHLQKTGDHRLVAIAEHAFFVTEENPGLPHDLDSLAEAIWATNADQPGVRAVLLHDMTQNDIRAGLETLARWQAEAAGLPAPKPSVQAFLSTPGEH